MNFFRKSCLLLTAVTAALSCNQASDQKTGQLTDTTITTVEASPKETAPPNRESAETALAGYYSDLNRKSETNTYKGLELKILKIYQDSSGQQLIDAAVSGRKRKNPGVRDTATLPFREKLTLTLKFTDNRWSSDTLISATPF